MSQITSLVKAENACARRAAEEEQGQWLGQGNARASPVALRPCRHHAALSMCPPPPVSPTSCSLLFPPSRPCLRKRQRLGCDGGGDRQEGPRADGQRLQHQPCNAPRRESRGEGWAGRPQQQLLAQRQLFPTPPHPVLQPAPSRAAAGPLPAATCLPQPPGGPHLRLSTRKWRAASRPGW